MKNEDGMYGIPNIYENYWEGHREFLSSCIRLFPSG